MDPFLTRMTIATTLKKSTPLYNIAWIYIVMNHLTYLLLMDQFSPDTERTTYGHQ